MRPLSHTRPGPGFGASSLPFSYPLSCVNLRISFGKRCRAQARELPRGPASTLALVLPGSLPTACATQPRRGWSFPAVYANVLAMDDIKLTFAPSDTVDAFPDEMARLLSAMGHPEALVTDESQISDFLVSICVPSPEQVAKLEQALGRKIRPAPALSPEDDNQINEENDSILQALAELMGRPVSSHERLAELARQLHAQSVPITRH